MNVDTASRSKNIDVPDDIVNDGAIDRGSNVGKGITAGVDVANGINTNGDDEGNCKNSSEGSADDAVDGVAVADVGCADDSERYRDEVKGTFILSDKKAPSCMNPLDTSGASLVID